MVRTRVGYAGGTTRNPTYRSIGDHTETVQVEYDPGRITYEDLLRVFWASHSPERQPSGRQYMSIVFCHTEEQRKLALASKSREEARRNARIHTQIVPFTTFTLAEDYHQKYYLRGDPILRREFAAIYPNEADFLASTAVARVNGYLGGHGSAEQLQEELPRLGLTEAGGQRLLELLKGRTPLRCQ